MNAMIPTNARKSWGWLRLAGERISLDGRRLHAEPFVDLCERMQERLTDIEPRGTVLLGEFGAGKTALCAELARRIGPRALVIPLRQLARERAGLGEPVERWGASLRALDPQRLLLLDGLDEICPPGDPRIRQVYRALTRLPGRTWLLTGRTESFRTDPGPPADDQVDTLSRTGFSGSSLHQGADVETWRISGLAHETIERVMGPRADEVAHACARVDLAPSPILLEIASLAGQAAPTPTALFQLALDRLLGRSLEAWTDLAWRSFLQSSAGRQGALERAWIPEDEDAATFLLTRDEDDLWRFRHRSFYDFLVARRLSTLILQSQDGSRNDATGRTLSEAMRVFLAELMGDQAFSGDTERLRVPSGNFVAGGSRAGDERPVRIAFLPRAFEIARAPVRDLEIARWLEQSGSWRWGERRPASLPGVGPSFDLLRHWTLRGPPGEGLRPAFHLGLEGSERYAASQGARLPSADEWEKAARGLGGRRWPWGDLFDPALANTAERDLDHPLPADALPPQGPQRLRAMCGDVFELCSSNYREHEEWGRVVMGGSFAHPGEISRASLRLSHRLSGHLRIGLRLAWDPCARSVMHVESKKAR